MPKPTEGYTRITRDFPTAFLDDANKLAASLGVSLTLLMESAVTDYMRRHRNGRKLPLVPIRRPGQPRKQN